jgi:hypothetical protein
MLVRCAGHFVDSPLVVMEDPVEDAFIGNIATSFGNFRIFRGIEESGDFWTGQLLRPLEEPNVPELLKPIIKHVRALLTISDAVAERLKLKRYTFGSGKLRERLEIPQWRELIASAQAVIFSPADIKQLAITNDDLSPFILTKENQSRLLNQVTGQSDLERFPIIQFGESLVLAAPHAITLSVRRFIIEQLEKTGVLGFLNMFLHTRQAEEWFSILRRPLHFEPVNIVLPKPPSDFLIIHQAVTVFDEGKYAHLVFLDGNVRGQLIDSHETDRISEQRQEALENHLHSCAEILKQQPHYNGGMTLITRGGVGRGLVLEFKKLPDNWEIVFESLPAWHTLAGSGDASALRLWRMLQQQNWAKVHGLTIQNFNGLLNLFACWRNYGWRFFVRDIPLANPNKLLALDMNFLTSIRKKVLQAHDEHSCRAHNSTGWTRVQRKNPKANKPTPIYFASDAGNDGVLLGSIETATRIWWIASKTNHANREQRDVIFRLWDCLLNWMASAAAVFEKSIPNLPSESIWIEIDVVDVQKWADDGDFEKMNSELPQIKTDTKERKVVISVPAGFKKEFHVPENRGERILLNCLISALVELAGTSLTESSRVELISAIFPNHDARFFHVVKTENWARMLGGTRKSPDFIPEEDCIQSLIGLAEEIGNIPPNGKVQGENECGKYLEKAVDKLWERVEKNLNEFNRHSVILKCFSALVELEKDAEHRKMGARSHLALNLDEKEDEERRMKREEAEVANRILIETAMYASQQTGGRILPKAEHLELLAHLRNLILTANHRDAISEGFISPPEVHVFPNGELDVNDHFYKSVMAPYVQALFAKQFRSSAQNYEKWFSDHKESSDSDADEILDRLEQPFHQEFGVTISQFVMIPQYFGRFALENQKLVLEFDEPGIRSFLKEVCNLDEKSADLYLARFSLPPRRAWDQDLQGFEKNDVWPWKLRRRLSLLMRPLVLMSAKPEKRWLVYPPLLAMNRLYVLNGVSEAAFPRHHFQSEAMLTFLDGQVNRQGHEFEHEVANHLEQLGFHTRRNIFMTALGASASSGVSGDVDVLAWKHNSSNVLVIECKHLRMAASVRDVVDRLDEFRGERDDKLGKHLRRLNWLKSNPAAVSALSGIPVTAIQFRGLLVTNDLVPMKFFSGSLISQQDVVALNQLANLLK